ncbi:hypothetical protein FHP05_00125 [Cerasibacillus terrae]|uniref:TubC N-terminal docking domain-containing protein n=1 Tax=Cerasibacillus terrae TaxID=2498845 RepID=A0A5C8P2M9_9BACI|nr:hypothetical protein [Cerasibacillus terrae]TXL67466.1 hypothetical protein FHP05_00125 [Cerasibacillus terrae]
MDLTRFLHQLDNHRIDIWVSGDDLLVGMEESIALPDSTRNYIHTNRQQIKRRLLNNTFAQERNWNVANFGEVYWYQYSSSGYVFIERNNDKTVDVYRCRFDKYQKATNIKGLHENIPFAKAYQKAKSFLKWFYSKNPHLKKGKY